MALTMLKTITVTLKYTKDETQNRFLGVMEEKQFLNALKMPKQLPQCLMLHPVNTSPTFICQTYQNDEQSQQMLVCVWGVISVLCRGSI